MSEHGPLLVVIILGVSILLQLGAAFVAVLNIRRTRAYIPWVLVATAIFLMAVRRITSFVQIVAGWNDLAPGMNAVPELIALVISILMFTGLLRLGPVFSTISRLATERQVLLRESLHSTKNNLQSLLSLLNVQQGFLEGSREQTVAADMQRRVRVFVLLQEELFRSHSHASYREFMVHLVEDITDSFGARGQVAIEVDIDDLEVSDRELLYCGLVANEALTNAFKHAAPQAASPRITVRSGSTDGRRFLSVRDNGPGFSQSAAEIPNASFGMTFLNSISGTDGWEVRIDSSDGTEVRFLF